MIATSEIKVSVVVNSKYGELAMRALHDAFLGDGVPTPRRRSRFKPNGGCKKIQIYDTTLRDGCQSEDVSLTVEDKLEIAERLDDLGIDYIEGGWPGSNERDAAFFNEVKKLKLRHAKIAAFGSTRRANVRASADRNLQLLLRADTPVATVVGKTWDLHVREALRISAQGQSRDPQRHDRVSEKARRRSDFRRRTFLRRLFATNPEFALACLRRSIDAGVDLICAVRYQRRPPAA